MKKKAIRTLHFIEFIVLFFVLTIFLLQNPTTLRFIANKIIQKYNLKYEHLSGNLLTNIKIKKLSYDNKEIAKDVVVNFNLLYFLKGEIDIEFLKLQDVNIKNLRYFLNDLNLKSEKKDIPIQIKFDKVVITSLPYKVGKYYIKSIKLILNNFFSDIKTVTADNVLLDIKTNMWSINLRGNIYKSVFYAKANLKLNEKYFQKFIPNLNFKSLNPIKVIFNINKNFLVAYVETKSKKLFKKGFFNSLGISLDKLTSHVKFDFKKLELEFLTDATFYSKYTNKIVVNGGFLYDKTHFINYNGDIIIQKFKNIDKHLAKLLKNSQIHFQGNKNGIKAYLESDNLMGVYDSNTSYLTPTITINSKKLSLEKFYKDSLKNTFLKKINFQFNLQSKLNYKKLLTTIVDYNISSNLLEAKGRYKIKQQKIDTILSLTKNSILKNIDKKLYVDKLFPIFANIKLNKNKIFIDFNNTKLTSSIQYFPKTNDFNLSINGYSLKLDSSGKIDNFRYNIDIENIRDFDNKIKSLYSHKSLNLDGSISFTGEYKDKIYNFDIDAKWLLYTYAPYKFFFVEDLFTTMSYQDSNLTIFEYAGEAYILDRSRYLYSSTPSIINFYPNHTTLNFNINNSIKLNGYLTPTNKNIKIFTHNYHLKEPEANLYLNLNLLYKQNFKQTSLKGKIKLLNGTIMYKPKKNYIINDKDIIFVNQKKQKLIDNDLLNLLVKITSKKIKYKFDKNKIYFKTNLTLKKKPNKSEQLIGVISIINGVYNTNGKIFNIGRGELIFSGNLLNPYLNLKAYYRSEPYKITIYITGDLESPILNFTSSPPLTQNDILSILLFNTKASNLSNSTSSVNPAISIFGNTFAKGITSALGIKLNRVELTTRKDGKVGVELEKSLSDKTTIIYKNDIIQTIIVRHKINDKFESDFTFSPDSTGIDIIYTNER